MAKAGMRRPGVNEPHGTESNHKPGFNKDEPIVPEIQGKGRTSKKKINPVL
jgi:hypothetical protein